VVYRQSVCLGIKPLEAHDQSLLQSKKMEMKKLLVEMGKITNQKAREKDEILIEMIKARKQQVISGFMEY
jgi:hypothetical protein